MNANFVSLAVADSDGRRTLPGSIERTTCGAWAVAAAANATNNPTALRKMWRRRSTAAILYTAGLQQPPARQKMPVVGDVAVAVTRAAGVALTGPTGWADGWPAVTAPGVAGPACWSASKSTSDKS